MGSASGIWSDYVVKSILANNEFGIKEINDIVELSSGYFIKDEYAKILMLIENGDFSALKSLVETAAGDREYLHVLSFRDQRKDNYIVTVYDNNELCQDPQVIEIFPAK